MFKFFKGEMCLKKKYGTMNWKKSFSKAYFWSVWTENPLFFQKEKHFYMNPDLSNIFVLPAVDCNFSRIFFIWLQTGEMLHTKITKCGAA